MKHDPKNKRMKERKGKGKKRLAKIVQLVKHLPSKSEDLGSSTESRGKGESKVLNWPAKAETLCLKKDGVSENDTHLKLPSGLQTPGMHIQPYTG